MASFQPGLTWRIVLIGKTGVGKSAVGNTITKSVRFDSRPSAESVTTTCQKEETTWSERLVTVVDTPGILDTDKTPEFIRSEIVRCVQVSCPGPHVFLLVIQAGRFTKEERNSVEALQELFGPEADKFMMVLFTRGGELESDINDYLCESDPELRRLIQRCGNRYHVFENFPADEEQRRAFSDQVEKLFSKIDDINAVNGGEFYTDAMYQEVEQRRAEHQSIDENQYSFIGALMRRVRNFMNILQRD